MQEIHDCIGRLACKGDARTGLVESAYRGHKTRTTLSIGSVFTIERDGIVTNVIRISTEAFKIDSHPSAA